jgi:hypothetical protein
MEAQRPGPGSDGDFVHDGSPPLVGRGGVWFRCSWREGSGGPAVVKLRAGRASKTGASSSNSLAILCPASSSQPDCQTAVSYWSHARIRVSAPGGFPEDKEAVSMADRRAGPKLSGKLGK